VSRDLLCIFTNKVVDIRGNDKKRGRGADLESLLEVSNKQTKLLKPHPALNIKGKNLQLYREIRKGFGKEWCALRALKNKTGYESDDLEAIATKESVKEYKHMAEDALNGLKNVRTEEAAVASPTTSLVDSHS
jgi:hypothetical protein